MSATRTPYIYVGLYHSLYGSSGQRTRPWTPSVVSHPWRKKVSTRSHVLTICESRIHEPFFSAELQCKVRINVLKIWPHVYFFNYRPQKNVDSSSREYTYQCFERFLFSLGRKIEYSEIIATLPYSAPYEYSAMCNIVFVFLR